MVGGVDRLFEDVRDDREILSESLNASMPVVSQSLPGVPVWATIRALARETT